MSRRVVSPWSYPYPCFLGIHKGERKKGIPIYGIHKGERRKGNEREGGGEEERSVATGEEDSSLHVVSETKDMENEKANTEPIFRIKLVKIAKGRGLLSILEML